MRQVADPPRVAASTPVVMNRSSPTPVSSMTPERRVAGVGERCRRLGEAQQQGVEGELRAQRDARVDEEVQPVGDARVGLHGEILP